jgi:hypothetical protein
VLNAASVETKPRLSKKKASLKIDGAVALSFAVVAAEQFGVPADIDHGFSDEIKVISNYDGPYFDRW